MADEDRPEKVKFRTNIPQRLKFRYATAKKHTHEEFGDSYFYGVVDGDGVQRPLFATPTLHALIQFLPLQAGQTLEIAKLEDPQDGRKVIWTLSNGEKEINSADCLDAAFEALRAAEDAAGVQGDAGGGEEADSAPQGSPPESPPAAPPTNGYTNGNGRLDVGECYVNHCAHLIRSFKLAERLLLSDLLVTDFSAEDVRALGIHIAIGHAKKPPTEKMLDAARALLGMSGPPTKPPVPAGTSHPDSTGDDDLPF